MEGGEKGVAETVINSTSSINTGNRQSDDDDDVPSPPVGM